MEVSQEFGTKRNPAKPPWRGPRSSSSSAPTPRYFAAGNIAALWVHRLLRFREYPPVVLHRFPLFKYARRKESDR